jgi:hypothetical protein
VTHSLGNVRKQLHELATGEGDLTKRLNPSGDDGKNGDGLDGDRPEARGH